MLNNEKSPNLKGKAHANSSNSDPRLGEWFEQYQQRNEKPRQDRQSVISIQHTKPANADPVNKINLS